MTAATTIAKAYDFPVGTRWLTGRRTLVSIHGKKDLEVATPPEFKGGIEGVWSPEDLLVASIGTCYAVTLLAVADRRRLPLRGLELGASGHVTRRSDGAFGFTEAVLTATVDTEAGFEDEARDAAEAAKGGCLVANSVDFPVRLELEVRAAPLLEAAI
ncbi:MAG TPA: OsmC family protein [Gaiellaceae bacterium]|nr:OsmC family protein [Gaiellaceae bacterium]